MPKANPQELESDRLDPHVHVRVCDHPDCAAAGEFRAPQARNRLSDYYWFCLDHVREYNKSWNYYAGMSDHEVEEDIRRSTTWERPTWRLGTARTRSQAFRGIHDPFDVLHDEGEKVDDPGGRRPSQDTAEGRAVAIMGLEPPLTLERLKRRYKELVKRHHPDANGGDKTAEERLKSINEAYTTLRRFLN
ncbi:MAG: J domain-containing protein [Alphaproteobacteria bacterium]|nr:J domain-containing protein [Alphaproteobacteria bacterium]